MNSFLSIHKCKYAADKSRSLSGILCCCPRLVRCGIILVSLLLWAPPFLQISHGFSPRVEQEQLKAVYLYNFLQFVTWPNNAKRPDPALTMVIGVVGDSPMNQALEDLTNNLPKTNKTTIRIMHFGNYVDGMDLSACNVLFISPSEKPALEKIIAGLRSAPVLTVGDTDTFLSAGVMITMLEQQDRIRYHVNRKAAVAAGLRLSSQLLKTAISVQDE